MASARVLGRQLLLVAGGIVVALLAGEMVVRFFDLGPGFHVLFRERFQLSENSVLEYELRPGASDGDARINRGGFRDREFPVAKPPGVFRIVALGDSVTYGSGAPRSRAWPKRLEELFDEVEGAAPRVEVLNFGVAGYNATQIAERLRVLGLRYQPDLVVYGYVLNDPQSFSVEGAALRSLARQRADALGGVGRLLSGSRIFLMARHLLASSDLPAAESWARIAPDPAYRGVSEDPRGSYFRALHRKKANRERLAAALDSLAASGRTAGIPITLAIFPVFLDDAVEYSLMDVHDGVAKNAERRGLATLDLAPIYPARAAGSLRIDLLHPSPAGHLLAARAIRAWLCDSHLVPESRC